MNFVTTQHSSSKLGSVFAAPKFSDLFGYLVIWPFAKVTNELTFAINYLFGYFIIFLKFLK